MVDYFDNWYRNRILALQSVDDLVGDVFKRLERDPDILDNTYIIYTSDNGYHIGQHRLAPGKTCGIEEDINVPFIIRGPGIDKGRTVSIPTTHTDLVPTMFELAGIPLQEEFDGEPMPVTSDQLKNLTRKNEHVGIEYWGTGIPEGKYRGEGSLMVGGASADPCIKRVTYLTNVVGGGLFNTYKTVRVIGDDYSLGYVVWCLNEHELYDMKVTLPLIPLLVLLP